MCVYPKGTGLCREDYVPGHRTVSQLVHRRLYYLPGAQEEHTACVLEDPREDALAFPHSPHSFIQYIQIEHPLCARLCPRHIDSGDPYLLGLLPSIPIPGREIILNFIRLSNSLA